MNMRKIIAVLAAALMLCAAIPMGALTVAAAPGDVIVDADFNDGADGFLFGNDPAPTQEGILILDGTAADWANVWQGVNMSAETKYVVTFRAKADAAQNLSFKINNGWNGTNVQEAAAITTEWDEYELTLTPDANLSSPVFCIQTNTYKPDGTVFYLDWVKVEEYKEPATPGTVINGDFETGDATGWNTPQQGYVKAEAAHSGNYGIHIKGNGGWGGMLDQSIPVEAGKTYEITFWSKVNANGVNMQINDPAYTDEKGKHTLVSAWLNNTDWVCTTLEFTPVGNEIQINFCGAGNGTAEDAYVDDIVVSEQNVIWSIDFNDGDKKFNVGEVVAEGPDGSNCYKWEFGGSYNSNYAGGLNMDFTQDYTVTMKVKGSINSSMAITLMPGSWATWWNGPSFNVTTEWQEVVLSIPANSVKDKNGVSINANIFEFQGTEGLPAYILYVDDIVISKGLPEQPEQPEQPEEPSNNLIVNGDFEDGKNNWTNLWGSSTVEIVEGRSGSALKGTGNGDYHIVYQEVAVTPNTNYTVSAYSKNAVNANLWIKSAGGAANIDNKPFNSGSDWAETSITFNSGDNASVWVGLMALSNGATYTVDDVVLTEKPEQPANSIVNGDFEDGVLGFGTGQVTTPGAWYNLWGGTSHELVAGYNSTYALKGTASTTYNITYQNVVVKPNTDYTVSAYSKDSSNSALWIKNAGGNGDITSKSFNEGSDWALTSVSFNSGDNTSIWVGLMGIATGGTYTVDDVTIVEGVVEEPEEPAHELINGDFETGALSPWHDDYGKGLASIVEGYEGGSAMQITNAGQWAHIRQDNIAVKPNTTYRLSANVMNNQKMAFVVKNGGDDYNLITEQQGGAFPEGEVWQYFSMEFNTGVDEHGNAIDIDSICILVIAYEDGGSVIIDNIVLEEVVCEHEYADCLDTDCDICGAVRDDAGHKYYYECDAHCMNCGEETNPRAKHSKIHVEAKEAVSCIEFGNIEYWYCEHCNTAWLDEAGRHLTNMKSIMTAGECVSDSPACKDGVCINCDLPCGAEAEHEYDDEYDADCNVCGDIREVPERPADVLYGDVDGDGKIDTLDEVLLAQYLAEWDVELDEVAADVDGDGKIDTLDEVLLAQFLAEWDVVLGPQAE